MRHSQRKLRKNSGFTLIESMIALTIMSVGVLALGAVYAQGLLMSQISQYDYIAEKKAEQAMEAIFTARDSKILQWVDIENQSQSGVFLDGPQKILLPGPDGLVGDKFDTGSADEVVLIGPGPDGVFGTADDQTLDLNPWMTRTIAFTTITGETNLRQVTITINYTINQTQKSYTLVSYISAFA